MPRYIEAVKSAEIISEKLNIPLGDLVDVFAEIPTADVVERERGEWIVEVFALTMCKKVYCSVCGYSETKGPAWEKNWGLHNFCPNCGAKMKEGD